MSFDMSKLKLREPVSQSDLLPIWVSEGSDITKSLYEECINTFEHILARMKAGDPLPIRERQLVARRIAQKANCNHSNVSKRRQAGILELIVELNLRLGREWKRSKGSSSPPRSNISKKDLVRENRNLRKELEQLVKRSHKESLLEVLESELLVEHKNMAKRLALLDVENKQLHKEIGNLKANSKIAYLYRDKHRTE